MKKKQHEFTSNIMDMGQAISVVIGEFMQSMEGGWDSWTTIDTVDEKISITISRKKGD
jgi:hypothetical protein